MPSAKTASTSPPTSLASASRSRWRAIFRMLLLSGGLYGAAAYVAAPEFWRYYSRHHPALAALPVTTQTGDGTPADPLNFALVGTRREVVHCLVAAGWRPADPLSLKSSLEIVEASVLGKPYETAPVSNLFLWGRPQDLAFEKPVGNNPRQRHHVRFWESAELDANGRPLWAGAAIFDRAVELSRRTGQVTHQIDGDIDRERETLVRDLTRTNRLLGQSYVDDFQPVKSGKNGGGDHWHTDGRLFLAIVAPELQFAPEPLAAPQPR